MEVVTRSNSSSSREGRELPKITQLAGLGHVHFLLWVPLACDQAMKVSPGYLCQH